MIPYLVLLVAAMSRFVPHALHGVGLNVTAVNGGLLYFGARRPRVQAIFAVLLMALTDVCLTTLVYQYPFHVGDYVVTWLWYAAVCVIGSSLLRRISGVRVAAAVFSSATGFFLISNFAVWMSSQMYAHSAAGLAHCYVAALPFYTNDLVSTALTLGVLFYLPVVAAVLVNLLRHTQASGELLR